MTEEIEAHDLQLIKN